MMLNFRFTYFIVKKGCPYWRPFFISTFVELFYQTELDVFCKYLNLRNQTYSNFSQFVSDYIKIPLNKYFKNEVEEVVLIVTVISEYINLIYNPLKFKKS